MVHFYFLKELILKRAADTLETCYRYSRPRPSYPNSKTSGIYTALYKSPLNDNVPPYNNISGGFFINPTSSQNGCTYVSNQVPTPLQSPSFLSSASCSSTTDENRIIVNGTSGPLPSVSTLTTSRNSTGSHLETDNQQLSPMLSRGPGNSFSAGYSNFQVSPGTIPSNFGIPASPSMMTGATGWLLNVWVFVSSVCLSKTAVLH